MLILSCPNCGERNVSEFRFGGEVAPRPANPDEAGDDVWTRYLYLRANRRGVQTEWWYHQAGCGLWFLADRDWGDNEVVRTYPWSSEAGLPGAVAREEDRG